jgi:NADH/NAD ratio-sensing transcriptional regulator Rex
MEKLKGIGRHRFLKRLTDTGAPQCSNKKLCDFLNIRKYVVRTHYHVFSSYRVGLPMFFNAKNEKG